MEDKNTDQEGTAATKKALELFQKARNTKEDPPQLIETPIRSKFRHLAKDFEQTLKSRLTRQQSAGVSRWIFKTEMKIVSYPLPSVIREAMSKEATISKLKAYNEASSISLNRTLALYEETKARVLDLLVKVEQAKRENVALKRKLLAYEAKRNRTIFLQSKYLSACAKVQKDEELIASFSTMISENQTKIQSINEELLQLRSNRRQTQAKTEKLERQIAKHRLVAEDKHKQLQELATCRMPNHQEVVNSMFCIGILYEQIYILDMDKSLRRKASVEEATQKGPPKDKEFVARNISKAITASQATRMLGVQCKDSQLVVFKVLTGIYMHCRSLTLPNIVALMKKTSFFSEEFRKIYDYSAFQKYMSALIERNKGNYLFQTRSNSSSRQRPDNTVKVNIITNLAHKNFLQRVLSCLERKDQDFVFVILNIQIQLRLFAIENLLEKQKAGINDHLYTQTKYSLRIILQGLEEHQ